MRRWILGTAGVAIVIWLASVALTTADLPAYTPEGQPVALPENGLMAVDRSTFDGLLIGQRGTPVVVNIWASWCAPCRAEMPLLDEAATAYAGRAVILGVASNDNAPAAASFLDEVDVAYPNVFDADGSVAAVLEVARYPTTFVFDADGLLRARVEGGISEQQLAGLIEDVLP